MQFGDALARGTFHDVATHGGMLGQIHELVPLANPQPQHLNPFPILVKVGLTSGSGGTNPGCQAEPRLGPGWAGGMALGLCEEMPKKIIMS